MISMKKVEAIFIASKLDTVSELLSERCGLDIAMSQVNQPHDRGQAVLLADLPRVRLETVVSEGQAMPTVQTILRASRNAPGIDLVSIGVSRVDSQAPRLRESLPPRRQNQGKPSRRLRALLATECNRCGYRKSHSAWRAQRGG